MIDTTFHIRRPLARSRSTSWYRDHSNRGRGTFCGAPETRFDHYGRGTPEAWVRSSDGQRFEPCATCLLNREVG